MHELVVGYDKSMVSCDVQLLMIHRDTTSMEPLKSQYASTAERGTAESGGRRGDRYVSSCPVRSHRQRRQVDPTSADG